VLQSKGLRRAGLVYVLQREDELKQLARELEAITREWNQVVAQMRLQYEFFQRNQTLLGSLEQQRLNAMVANDANPVTFPAKTSTQAEANAAAAARAELSNRANYLANLANQIEQLRGTLFRTQVEYQNLRAAAASREADYYRGEAQLNGLAAELRKRYKELGDDSDVKVALEILNKDSERRYALGPREDYAANVKAMALAVLQAKGFQAVKGGGGVELGADVDLQTAVFYVESSRNELLQALKKQKSWKDAAAFRRKTAAASWKQEQKLESEERDAATAVDAKAKGAELQSLRGRIARLRQEEHEAEKARKEIAADLAEKRARFVACAGLLRKAIEVSHEGHEEVDRSAEVKRALADLKKRPKKKPKAHDQVLLEEVEAAIRTEKVPLIPDRNAQLLSVTVNSAPGRKMVVDPNAEVVRVSERFAAAVGLHPDDNEPPVTFTTPDGRTLQGRRATIPSVQLGPFPVTEVDCLIVLGDYDAPPVLGANVLDQFLVQHDPDAGMLTLTRINVKPAVSRPAPHGGSGAPAKSKDRPKAVPARIGG
jgi:chromosome segregation ATPase